MFDKIFNVHYKALISVLIDIISGFVILFFYIQLCSCDFFPMYYCFCRTDSSIFNLKLFSKVEMFFEIAYAIYSIFFFICYLMKDWIVFQKIKRFCVDCINLYMRSLLISLIIFSPFILIYMFICLIGNTFEIPCYVLLNRFFLLIYFISVFASLFIIPIIVLSTIILKIYNFYINPNLQDNDISTPRSNNKGNNASINNSVFQFIFNKQNMIGEFFYRYSILVLWGLFGFMIFLFFIIPSMPKSDNGMIEIFILSRLVLLSVIIVLTIMYFIFSIVIRSLLRRLFFNHVAKRKKLKAIKRKELQVSQFQPDLQECFDEEKASEK